MPRLILMAALVAAAAALASCAASSTSPDEEAITKAIEVSGTTDDPSECTELETQRFVEQNQFEKGTAAISECMKTDTKNDADAVDVTNIKVDGDTATAEATVTGATFDGQTLQISLVKQDGKWKLDHIDSFKDFDKDKFVESFAANLETNGDFTPQQSKCISDALAGLDDAALQALVLSGDQNQLVPVLGPCLR